MHVLIATFHAGVETIGLLISVVDIIMRVLAHTQR